MSIQEQVGPERWAALWLGPAAVGLYVATAVGGKVQEVRELLALAAEMRQALERDHEHDLVGAVAAMVVGTGPDATPALNAGNRLALLEAVGAAGAAATGLEGAGDYRRWLMSLARAVAVAEEDGGFLGIGAEALHLAEQLALAELASALGLLEETRS